MVNEDKLVEWLTAARQNINQAYRLIVGLSILGLVEAGAIIWLILRKGPG